MAFTVGGGTEATSYVSIEYADGYFADRGVAGWAGQVAAKQGALVRATDYVRALFAARFDPEPFVEVAPELPEALSKAVCEYALVELKTPGGLAPAPTVDASGYSVVKTKRKIGPIESNFAVVGGDGAQPRTRRIFPVADALIASLLLPGGAGGAAQQRTTR